MAKFIRVTKPEAKSTMIKVYPEGSERFKWYACSKAVHDYASKNFKEEDEISLQFGDNDYVIKATKGSGETTRTENKQEEKQTPKHVCEDCGKELKDDKYAKCYECNKKNPSKKSEKKTYGKSPEETEGMRRGNILNAVSRSLIALQGQIDRNSMSDVIKELYKTYDELTK